MASFLFKPLFGRKFEGGERFVPSSFFSNIHTTFMLPVTPAFNQLCFLCIVNAAWLAIDTYYIT